MRARARKPEFAQRVKEPVSEEVMRKLHAAVTRAEETDRAIHDQMGLRPSGTIAVPVRYNTLRTLLAWLASEHKGTPET